MRKSAIQMKTLVNTIVMHRGDCMGNFIMVEDAKIAEKLISAGYKPLSSEGGFFIFENVQQLTTFCEQELVKGSYVFTNSLFF